MKYTIHSGLPDHPFMKQYSHLTEIYSSTLIHLSNKRSWLSIARLASILLALICVYFYTVSEHSVMLFAAVVLVIAFILLLRMYQKNSRAYLLTKTLSTINSDEVRYTEQKELPFKDGDAYNDASHTYSFDLDFFGKKSLFQHLNRTATYIGETTLAKALKTLLPADAIQANQAAIRDLAPKLEWRQDILAHARIANDTMEVYQHLLNWSATPKPSASFVLRIVSFVSPVLLLGSLLASLFTDGTALLKTAEALFVMHLVILASQFGKIKEEILHSDKIDAIILQYSIILKRIESESFESTKLNAFKAQLNHTDATASDALAQLSVLFAKVSSVQNAVGAGMLNGLFLYHIHALYALAKWKAAHADKIAQWMNIIGEIEMLNSFANLSYNNPSFIFPELNNEYQIRLNDVGHPLIAESKRVCNNVHFNKSTFIILTGSNMSGKSTFLRTLGVNMVLAGTGAPICASAASIHPLPVIVSMRLSDSLSDSESYFFAEVKRLKQLMNALEQEPCFVLLDEILRGTNSDDKRNGTIEVIKKVIGKNGIGAIATHDLEVCNTTAEYPDKLENKCFEVEIVDNDLAFDYKLRDGVCKNKSATFLMKKMEII